MLNKLAKTLGSMTLVAVLSVANAIIFQRPAHTMVASSWEPEPIDEGAYFVSLRFDGADMAHAVYAWSGSIKYASKLHGAWVTSTIDSGSYPSLALTSGGQPRVSYYKGGLNYASWNRATWVTETVDAGNNIGMYTSVELDAADHPHISYTDRNSGTLYYATHDGIGWTRETIDAGMPSHFEHSSLALDSNGVPSVAYYGSWRLRFASKIGAVWSVETVDNAGTNGSFPSLEFDGNDKPHISYFSSAAGKVQCASRYNATWTTTPVGNGTYTRLALDRANLPHVVYWSPADNIARHAWFDGLGWNNEIVGDAPGLSQENWRFAIAADSSGRPAIAFSGQGTPLVLATRQLATPSVAFVPDTGGVLHGSDGTVFAFPAGTFAADVVITQTPSGPFSAPELVSVGNAFSLTAIISGTAQSTEPAIGRTYTITVHYSDRQKCAAIEDSLKLYSWDNSIWIPVTTVVTSNANVLTATSTHFSLWAVFGESRHIFVPMMLKGQ
jgi:hypothetical protein